MVTKAYKVTLTSLEHGGKFTVKAIGIPSISDEISNVNIKDIAERIGLSGTKICRGTGPAGIPIGIDYAYKHTGETKQAGNVVARRSPLGWVTFGAPPSEVKQENKVLHVKYSQPVDLTEFWTTEAMGVDVQHCQYAQPTN